MSKYTPLAEFLARSGSAEVRMTFSEIESLVKLPPTARKERAWWANATNGHSQTNGWLAAGYRTRDVDIEGTTILFVKDDEPLVRPQRNPAHPVLGCMEGTVTVMPGVDLTEPAMPEWAETVANAKLYNE